MGKKITLEECILLANEKGGECLSDTYVNTITKMRWRCKCGNEWDSCFRNILYWNSWCPICAKDKFKQTCIDKYGVDNPIKFKEIKKRVEQFFLDKYNGKSPFSSKEVREKSKKTCLERYGAEYSTKTKEIVDKIKQTNTNRYGGNSPTCSKKVREKVKQTCLDRYGVDNPTKDKDIALKAVKTSNKSYIRYHWQSKEELVCQGSWEAKVIDYLNLNKVNYQWQPRVFTLSNGSTYRPDLFLIDSNTWVEIKGYFREDAKIKWEEFLASYTNSELWTRAILRKKGIIV